MSLASCSAGKDPSALQSGKVLLAASLSAHDTASGVTQASAGIQTESSSGGLISTLFQKIGGKGDVQALKVSGDQSLFRIKIASNTVPVSPTAGVVHYVVEYENIAHLLKEGDEHSRHGLSPDSIRLTVDRVLIYTGGGPHDREGGRGRHERDDSKPFIYVPAGKDAQVTIASGRHYIALVRNLHLPAGQYRKILVFFKPTGTAYFTRGIESPVKVADRQVVFDRPFTVETGQITTLHSVPPEEYEAHRHDYDEHHPPGRDDARNAHGSNRLPPILREVHYTDGPAIRERIRNLPVHLEAKEIGVTITPPVTQVYISMKSISAFSSTGHGYLLNNTPTVFELLSLKDGAVGLMGSNMLPAGSYGYFEIQLGDTHTLVVGGQSDPLTVEFPQQHTFRFIGPFDLRGGRLTEVFLSFDPDSSIFYTERFGYILDPTVEVTSAISMTSAQDLRLIQALGPVSSLVVSSSELIFQGTVNSANTLKAANIFGKQMIYNDLDLAVEDRLRGQVADPAHFPLRMIGGTYGGVRLQVPGMPEFKSNEHFLLFLKKYGDRYGVVYGEMGKINL